MSLIELSSPAKINIGLDVGLKREDGYHNISSLMVPLQLEDRIKISGTKSKDLSVKCASGEKNSYQSLPQERENICFKTASIFIEQFPVLAEALEWKAQ